MRLRGESKVGLDLLLSGETGVTRRPVVTFGEAFEGVDEANYSVPMSRRQSSIADKQSCFDSPAI